MCGFVTRRFLIFRTEKGEINIEIKQDYSILFNTITDTSQKLKELLKIGEECLQILEEAQQITEEINISVDD